MFRPMIAVVLAFVVLAFVPPVDGPAQAQSVEDFYRGKRLTLTVGYGPGGGYDVFARLVARHLGRFLPGNPTIIVQNMPGAGSLRCANFLYNLAPRDGTAIGHFSRGLAMEPLIGTSPTQFDARRFGWLGSGTDEVSIFVTWHSSAVKSWDDALIKPFTVAGEGSGSDPDVFSAVLKNAFGARLKLVSGYPAAPRWRSRSSAARLTAASAGRGQASSCSNRTGWRDSASISLSSSR